MSEKERYEEAERQALADVLAQFARIHAMQPGTLERTRLVLRFREGTLLDGCFMYVSRLETDDIASNLCPKDVLHIVGTCQSFQKTSPLATLYYHTVLTPDIDPARAYSLWRDARCGEQNFWRHYNNRSFHIDDAACDNSIFATQQPDDFVSLLEGNPMLTLRLLLEDVSHLSFIIFHMPGRCVVVIPSTVARIMEDPSLESTLGRNVIQQLVQSRGSGGPWYGCDPHAHAVELYRQLEARGSRIWIPFGTVGWGPQDAMALLQQYEWATQSVVSLAMAARPGRKSSITRLARADGDNSILSRVLEYLVATTLN